MKVYLFILLAFLSAAFADEDETHVVTLTDDNFQDTISKNANVFVEFYAPWCGHCKKLEPEWKAAAAQLKDEDVIIAAVDATEEKNVAEKFGIRGYPTLKYFQDGVPKDYQGPRETEGLVSYVRKQMSPAVTLLESEEDVEAHAKKDKVVVVGFFESAEGEEYTAFEGVAKSLRDNFLFGAVVGGNVAEKFGAKTPGHVLFKQFDEGKVVHEDGDLSAFIKENSIPLLDEIGPNNYQGYMESGLPLLYLFLEPTSDNDALKDAVTESARTHKGKLNFCWIDNSKYNSQAGRLGLTGNNVPAVAIDDSKAGLHYAFDESAEVTAEAVTAWVNKFAAGDLEPTIKSEEIPENNDGPVTVVVQKSFDDIVKNREKDVFVEFYAPWCGHCKKLAPAYEKLGEAFQSVDSVVIAKIDATANDIDPKLGIRGFPTLKFFPANNKDAPLSYEGERTAEGIANFIKEKAATKFEVDTESLKDEL